MYLQGSDAENFKAQEAESATLGFELSPSAIPGFSVGVNYYRIDYRDRIADPPFVDVIFNNPESFAGLMVQNPTVEQVNEFIALGGLGLGLFALEPDFSPDVDFDPASIDVLFDIRRRNLSAIETRGFDLTASYSVPAGAGTLSFGLDGTYILDLEQRVSEASDPFDSVDTFFNPPQWRARGSMGWQGARASISLFVNHTNAYSDNRRLPTTRISSYTTADLNFEYDFGAAASGFLAGVSLGASVQNVFDADPPRATVFFNSELGFDPTNSNPMGRFLAVDVRKVW
jgi:iron complex outermembrane recepter protein